MKSMTKDGGMVAQSFVVDCCIARARGQNRGEDQAGEFKGPVGLRPAREPRRATPAPIAIAANATTPGRTRKGPHSDDFGAEFDE